MFTGSFHGIEKINKFVVLVCYWNASCVQNEHALFHILDWNSFLNYFFLSLREKTNPVYIFSENEWNSKYASR